MGFIQSVGTAVPRYRLPQERTRVFSRSLFAEDFQDIDRLLRIFDNADIAERYFSAPPEWFELDHAFPEKNRLYVETALELGERAIRKCLDEVGVDPGRVDHLIFVSSTGLATPSLDALLVNRLKMRHDLRRTPIWGLGCAGGAAGLARAYEFTRAFPESCVVVLALELCALTFQRNDRSKSNLVATSLFGDGAAAVLVGGEESGLQGPRILAARSHLWYDTLDVMGWEVTEGGLKVLFSRDIPSIVRECFRPRAEKFLEEEGIGLGDIRHFVAHPGGAKVLAAYQDAMGLAPGQMRPAREVLRRFGNMSSPTVLFVLEEFLRSECIGPLEHGLVSALGPGFSLEMLLIRG